MVCDSPEKCRLPGLVANQSWDLVSSGAGNGGVRNERSLDVRLRSFSGKAKGEGWRIRLVFLEIRRHVVSIGSRIVLSHFCEIKFMGITEASGSLFKYRRQIVSNFLF